MGSTIGINRVAADPDDQVNYSGCGYGTPYLEAAVNPINPNLLEEYPTGAGSGWMGVEWEDGSGSGAGVNDGVNGSGRSDQARGDPPWWKHDLPWTTDQDGVEVFLDQSSALSAYHYIKRQGDHFITRTGTPVKVGDILHEPEIKLCKRGLHASFSPHDAEEYAPPGSVLTEVKVWGRVIIGRKKLVCTQRQIIGVAGGPS